MRFGLALHVGEVMFGNIGASARLDFTVIGPAVNHAARLEKLCARSTGRSSVSGAGRAAAGARCRAARPPCPEGYRRAAAHLRAQRLAGLPPAVRDAIISRAGSPACIARAATAVADDSARSGLDLDGDRHPGRQVDETCRPPAFACDRATRARRSSAPGPSVRWCCSAPCGLSADLSCGLSRVMASWETLSTLPWSKPVPREIERIDLDLASWPASTKPMSRLETIASISRWLSSGTRPAASGPA